MLLLLETVEGLPGVRRAHCQGQYKCIVLYVQYNYVYVQYNNVIVHVPGCTMSCFGNRCDDMA